MVLGVRAEGWEEAAESSEAFSARCWAAAEWTAIITATAIMVTATAMAIVMVIATGAEEVTAAGTVFRSAPDARDPGDTSYVALTLGVECKRAEHLAWWNAQLLESQDNPGRFDFSP